ncbi:MAG: Lrp/AsnC family transcriptional regulator [Candidatus Woesearchaeota archaeon]
MDKTEKKLLLCLRRNGRISLSEISRKTGIPTTTVFERMKTFNYTRNVTLLDFEKMGFGIRVFLAIKAGDKEALQEFLTSNQNINSLCRINNGFDFFCEAVFRSIRDSELFNDTLQILKARARTFFIAEELRKEHLFTKREHFKLLSLPA